MIVDYGGSAMAPGKLLEEVGEMREKLVQLEAELQRHRESQHAGEAHFRLLADAAPVMIWMSGPDALYTYFNRPGSSFRGRTLDERPATAGPRLAPDDRDLCLETYLKSFGTRQPFRMRYRLRRADDEYSWVEVAGVPRFEDGGAFAGFMGSAIDISDRKRGIFTPDQQSVRVVFALTERERQVLVLIAQGKSDQGDRLPTGHQLQDRRFAPQPHPGKAGRSPKPPAWCGTPSAPD